MRIKRKTSLKSLLIFVAVLSIGFAYFDQKARTQRNVVEDVVSRGGRVMNGDSISIDLSYFSNLFHTATKIEFSDAALDSELAALLNRLPSLESVKFTGSPNCDPELLASFRSEMPDVNVDHAWHDMMEEMGWRLSDKVRAISLQ